MPSLLTGLVIDQFYDGALAKNFRAAAGGSCRVSVFAQRDVGLLARLQCLQLAQVASKLFSTEIVGSLLLAAGPSLGQRSRGSY